MNELKELYFTLFRKRLDIVKAGILLGIGNILLFLTDSPAKGTPGYVNLGKHIYKVFGFDLNPKPILEHKFTVFSLSICLGALCASLLSREFTIRVSSWFQLIKGALGGALMAFGATIGGGCTIGGFFSGWSALSGGALVLAFGMVLGAILGINFLSFEMERFPKLLGPDRLFLSKGRWQPILGAVILLLVSAFNSIYYEKNVILTWFFAIGLLFGMVCQRSRFCIARAIREPFMTGESKYSVGLIAGLAVSIFGFFVIKYIGLCTEGYEGERALALNNVVDNFWLRALIGGIIFGFGMVVASGCAISSLWKAGEGQTKLIAAAFSFSLFAPLSEELLRRVKPLLPVWAKEKVFLPDIFGYGKTAILFCGILLLWWVFIKHNERTGRFIL